MILELKNISKSFGEKKVLKGVTFRAESGKAFGLLGPLCSLQEVPPCHKKEAPAPPQAALRSALLRYRTDKLP